MLLASRVDFDTGQKIADLDIDGIKIEPLPTRIYPQGELMAQIVGIFAEDERIKDYRGYYGVEGFYQTLAGRAEPPRHDQHRPRDRRKPEQPSRVRNGISLVLTIDRDLQYLAQDVLREAVENDPTATGGTILIMNPRTGEILAMANYPPFNPDDASSENLKRARNPAVSEIYEPGSIFKVLTLSMALDAGTHDLDWTYYDPGCLEMAAILICDWDRSQQMQRRLLRRCSSSR